MSDARDEQDLKDNEDHNRAGEELVRQELITREELAAAREREATTGTPWYRQLIQSGKVPFGALEDVLWYEFNSPSKHSEHNELGEALLDNGAITREHLSEALAEQKRTGRLLGKILQQRGYVSEEAIVKMLARQHGLDFAPLSEYPSTLEALEAVPESMARKNELVPVALEGDRLIVLIANPATRDRLDAVGVLLGKRLSPLLTACDDIRGEIERRYRALKNYSEPYNVPGVTTESRRRRGLRTHVGVTPGTGATARDDGALGAVAGAGPAGSGEGEGDEIRFNEIARQASGASVIKMVQTIIEGAVNSGATDIHLDPQDPEMRVRYRIDGVLHDIMSIPQNLEAAAVSRIKILSELDITETRHPQDGHISTMIGDREFDIRVATLPTFLGERVVLRLLDQTAVLSGIKDLGLEKADEDLLRQMVGQPYGMILVTGPTGSGKTTTLYASLNQKNVMTDSIVTLEDPVEYQIPGINQVQVDPDINLTFASTLRAALRQDIDVLLVGEIRDSETAHIAIRAAMTGHLVFSTLHTNDAPEAISTLRNMGVASYLIASALTGVVGQRLVRTICPDCKESFKPDAPLLQSLGLPANTKKLYRGKGCGNCYHTGTRGREGVFEVMAIDPEVRKLIADDASQPDLVAGAKLKSMAERAREKVKRGIVSPDEYLRIIRA